MLKKGTCLIIVGMMLAGLLLSGCGSDDKDKNGETSSQTNPSAPNYQGKKIVLVDSYNSDYAWSTEIETGVRSALDGTGIDLKVIHMDTKNNPGEAFGQQAGEQAKTEIDAFKPDVIIACDDNAQRYLVVPYYKDTSTPVVFCGVNWEAASYGFPTSNVTGMVEIDLAPQAVELVKSYAKGDRIGFVAPDNETERKNVEVYTRDFFPEMKVTFVNTYDDFKPAFLDLQEQVDILFLSNNVGIQGWNDEDAKQFLLENTTIPTISGHDWVIAYTLLVLAKPGGEQGDWAARTALNIIDGTPVSEIPISRNQEGVLYVNLDLAAKLNIAFSANVLRNAITVGGQNTTGN